MGYFEKRQKEKMCRELWRDVFFATFDSARDVSKASDKADLAVERFKKVKV